MERITGVFSLLSDSYPYDFQYEKRALSFGGPVVFSSFLSPVEIRIEQVDFPAADMGG